MKYLKGIDIEDFRWPKDLYETWEILCKFSEKYGNEEQADSEGDGKNGEHIWDMTEKDLLKHYYKGLLKRTMGNVTLASKMANLHKNTLRSRLTKLGVPFKKTE
jgi:DNA-binding NtrC family response regulator